MAPSEFAPRKLVRPTEDDVQRILKTVEEALEEDKSMMLATGGSAIARSAYIRSLVDNANRFGEIYVAGPEPDFDGVALWAPPGVDWTTYDNNDYRKLLTQDSLEWLIHHAIPTYEGLYRSAFGSRGLDVSRQSWHLKLLVVNPSKQKEGLGQALVRAVATEASKEKYRIVTDCHTQLSVGFFQKLGFRHQAVKNFYSPFGIGFPMWCMLKEP